MTNYEQITALGSNGQPIVLEQGARLIIDTSQPLANMMHDASRPFAVCEKRYAQPSGRMTCLGRYETLNKAKRAAYYLGKTRK